MTPIVAKSHCNGRRLSAQPAACNPANGEGSASSRPPSRRARVFDRIRSRPRPRPRPRWPHKVERPRSRAVFALVPHIRAIQDARYRPADQRHPRPQASSSYAAPSPRPSNPLTSRSYPSPILPAVSSLRGFRTPAPSGSPNRRERGRRPKPFSIAVTALRRRRPSTVPVSLT